MADRVARKEAKRMAKAFGPLGPQLIGSPLTERSPVPEDVLARYRTTPKDNENEDHSAQDVQLLQQQLKQRNARSPQVERDYLAQYKMKEGDEKIEKPDPLQSYKPQKKKDDSDFLLQYRVAGGNGAAAPGGIEPPKGPSTHGGFLKSFDDTYKKKEETVDPLSRYRVNTSPAAVEPGKNGATTTVPPTTTTSGRPLSVGPIPSSSVPFGDRPSSLSSKEDPLDKFRVKSSGDPAPIAAGGGGAPKTAGRGADARLMRYFEDLPTNAPPSSSSAAPAPFQEKKVQQQQQQQQQKQPSPPPSITTTVPPPAKAVIPPVSAATKSNSKDDMTVEEIDQEIRRLMELKKKKLEQNK